MKEEGGIKIGGWILKGETVEIYDYDWLLLT